jgi:hypothetical protein
VIALFDEPPRITIRNPAAAGGSRNGLLMGMALDGKGKLHGVVVLEDGTISLLDGGDFSVDFRYNAESNLWTDQNEPEPDQG